MALPDLEAWAIFASVVEHRSFSGAAAALGLSKATVSKAVTRLETRINTALFHRTSRKLTLTATGAALAERAAQILADGESAEEAARDAASAPAGLVRIAAPMSFGIRHVAPVIADFLIAHPAVTIDLRLSDAHVDIVAEGIDIAVRIADLPDSSLRARRLSAMPTHVIGAPAYFAAVGMPRHPADLANHACLTYSNATNPNIWRFRDAHGEEAIVRVAGPLATDNGDAMLPLLRAGLGVARLPDFIVADDLAAGRLIAVLPEWSHGTAGLHLVTPPGTLRPARVEAAMAFLSEHLHSACVAQS